MKSRNGGRIVAARAAYNSLPEYPTSQTLADDYARSIQQDSNV